MVRLEGPNAPRDTIHRVMASDLSRLVRRCKAGDHRAWNELVEKFSWLVYATARRSGLGADDAEDVAQSTFLTLYKSLDRIENPDALAGWLSVTAARESYRVKRISSRYVNVGDDERTLDDVLVADETAADELADQSLAVNKVTEAMQQLREKCRDLLTALFAESAPSYQEISSSLGIPIGSIGPTKARCIESLRAILAKAGFFSDGHVSDPLLIGSEGGEV